jgi:hypothetical protein
MNRTIARGTLAAAVRKLRKLGFQVVYHEKAM